MNHHAPRTRFAPILTLALVASLAVPFLAHADRSHRARWKKAKSQPTGQTRKSGAAVGVRTAGSRVPDTSTMKGRFSLVGRLSAFGVKDTTLGAGTASASFEESMGVNPGLAARYEMAIGSRFSLGIQAALSFVRTQAESAQEIDRTTLFDLALVPALRLPLGQIELFAEVPFGLSVGLLNRSKHGVMVRAVEEQLAMEDAIGFHVGVGFGTHVLLTESVGLVFGLGWTYHSLSERIGIDGVGINVDTSWHELVLSTGLSFQH